MATRVLVAVCTILCGVGITRVHADDASHQKAIVELLDVLKLKEGMTTDAAAMADAMVESNPGMAPYRDVLITWANKTMTWEAMAPDIIALYKSTLSEAEARDIVAFFKTKSGQKWVTAMPDLMQRGSAIRSKIAEPHQQELMDMMSKRREELKQEDSVP